MAKIEGFQAAKATADKIRRARDYVFGLDRTDNDKHRFSASFSKLSNSSFAPIVLLVDAHHGYYGNSSAYSDTSQELGRYVAAAFNQHRRLIADTAVELAEADAEKARLAAEEEARAVLGETAA
ncbi:MAG: hypothetical protein ACR2RF_06085 [Geminicoccaceae bacterium]